MEIKDVFKLISSQMLGEFELVKLQPKELRGRAREVLVRRFLQPFLPESLGIGSGVIISSTGESSGEIDIVIYDKSAYNLFKPFTYFMPKEFRPIPSEVVYAIIEVEHKLTLDNLRTCVERIEKVKKLPKSAYYKEIGAIRNVVNLYGKEWEYFPTLGTVFAFDSIDLAELGNFLDQLHNQKKLSIEHQVDFICVLKKGALVHYDPEKLIIFPPKPPSQLRFKEGTSEDNLSLFYRAMMYVLTQVWTRPINLEEYFKV